MSENNYPDPAKTHPRLQEAWQYGYDRKMEEEAIERGMKAAEEEIARKDREAAEAKAKAERERQEAERKKWEEEHKDEIEAEKKRQERNARIWTVVAVILTVLFLYSIFVCCSGINSAIDRALFGDPEPDSTTSEESVYNRTPDVPVV